MRIGLLAAIAVAVALVAPDVSSAAELRFDRVLPGHFKSEQCAVGSLPLARCFIVDIGGLVPGLGRVSVHEIVRQSGDMDLDLCEPQVRYGTIVAARGTIEYTARGIDCPASREQTAGYRAVMAHWQTTGGTGAFAAVVGSGDESVRPDEDEVFIHLHGSIEVPGAVFDTTAPVFLPFPRTVTVRAGRGGEVRFATPRARDAVDGDVAVACAPRSPYRPRAARSTIRCEAVDANGNVAVATFVLIVRRPAR
jgi:hypothetical protein